MNDRLDVAQGQEADGLTWVIWARRDEPRDGDLLSLLRVSDPSGRILHAEGATGPPLHPGHLLNVRTGGSEEGPRVFLARVHPTVRRLELRTMEGAGMEVPVYDCPQVPEVRFAARLLPREVLLESVTGFGADGEPLERFDLRLQQGRWEARLGPVLTDRRR